MRGKTNHGEPKGVSVREHYKGHILGLGFVWVIWSRVQISKDSLWWVLSGSGDSTDSGYLNKSYLQRGKTRVRVKL